MRRFALLPVAALLIVVCLAALRISDEPLQWEEVVSIEFASQPIGDLADTVFRDQANMGPYYLALHGWLEFGDSPAWARALSVVGGLVSVAALALLARNWFNARTAAVAAVLLALHPFFLDYLIEARSYSWAAAAVLLGSLAIERDRVRPLLYGVAMGLACALSTVSALFIVAHGLAFLVLRVSRQMWHQLIKGVAVAAIAFAPFVPVLILRGSDPVAWVPEFSPKRAAHQLIGVSGGRYLGLVTAAMLLVYALTRFRSREFGPTMVMACVTVPIVGLAVVSLVQPLFVQRYLIAVVPFFALAAADLATRARHPTLVAGAMVAVLLIGGWPIDEDRNRWSQPCRHIVEDEGGFRTLVACGDPGPGSDDATRYCGISEQLVETTAIDESDSPDELEDTLSQSLHLLEDAAAVAPAEIRDDVLLAYLLAYEALDQLDEVADRLLAGGTNPLDAPGFDEAGEAPGFDEARERVDAWEIDNC